MFNDNNDLLLICVFFPVDKTFEKILNKNICKIKQNESEL